MVLTFMFPNFFISVRATWFFVSDSFSYECVSVIPLGRFAVAAAVLACYSALTFYAPGGEYTRLIPVPVIDRFI